MLCNRDGSEVHRVLHVDILPKGELQGFAAPLVGWKPPKTV